MTSLPTYANSEQLFHAVEQLPPDEFSQFVSRVVSLRAKRSASQLDHDESELLTRINLGLPTDLSGRYDQLVAKRPDETLAEYENAELLRLTAQVERLEFERMAALAELAAQRQCTLTELMQSLGITPPDHD